MSETLRWTADLVEKGFSRRFAFERELEHIGKLMSQPLNGPAELATQSLGASFERIGRIASITEINRTALDMCGAGDIRRLLLKEEPGADRTLLFVASLAGTVRMVSMGYARERTPNIRFFIEFTERMGNVLAAGESVLEQTVARPSYRQFVDASCGCGRQMRDSISYSYDPHFVNTRGLGKLAADLTAGSPLCSQDGWNGLLPEPGEVARAYVLASQMLAAYKRG